jgi:hypothetical protein
MSESRSSPPQPNDQLAALAELREQASALTHEVTRVARNVDRKLAELPNTREGERP